MCHMTRGEQVFVINHEQMKQWNICHNNNEKSSIEFQLKKGYAKFIPESEKKFVFVTEIGEKNKN